MLVLPYRILPGIFIHRAPFPSLFPTPVQDGNPGHRVRPSLEDIEAFIAPNRNLPEEERQTHFQMQTTTDDAEVNVVLSMLAGESSDSARTESVSAATRHGLGKDEGVQSPRSVHCK